MSVCRPNSSSRPGEAPRLPAGNVGMRTGCVRRDISRFFPRIDRIFSGKHLIHFLVLKIKDFRNFVLHNCVLVFDAEQVYLKLQVTNLTNKEVTVNPKPQILEKSPNSPYTLNHKP